MRIRSPSTEKIKRNPSEVPNTKSVEIAEREQLEIGDLTAEGGETKADLDGAEEETRSPILGRGQGIGRSRRRRARRRGGR